MAAARQAALGTRLVQVKNLPKDPVKLASAIKMINLNILREGGGSRKWLADDGLRLRMWPLLDAMKLRAHHSKLRSLLFICSRDRGRFFQMVAVAMKNLIEAHSDSIDQDCYLHTECARA